MKNLVKLLLLALLLGGCQKEPATPLTVAVSPSFPPFIYKSGEQVVGIECEILSNLGRETGREIVLKEMNFDELLTAVNSGQADLAISTISITEERKALVDFSRSYYRTGIVFVSPIDRPVKGFQDAQGRKVGVQTGTISEKLAKERLSEPPVSIPTAFELETAITNRLIDCVLDDAAMARAIARNDEGLAITSPFVRNDDYGVAVQKGRRSLLKSVNRTIAKMEASGELQNTINTWIRKFDKEAN